MDKVDKQAAADKQAKVKVVVNRDYWDDKGVRQPKGKVVNVPVEDAMEGIEQRKYVTYKTED